MTTGIYIHVPFCLSKCHYCDFVSSAYPAKHLPSYCKTVNKEISSVVEWLQNKWADTISSSVIDSIYFGGGTPSLVPPKYLSSVLKEVQNNFEVIAGAEITIEVNPDRQAYQGIELWPSLGINRVSIGVQSFEPRILKLLGRRHGSDDPYSLIRMAQKIGISNIGLDLIFGIPGQTTGELKKDLEKLLALQPTHISTYNLTIEKDTPLSHQIDSGDLKPVSEQMQVDMMGLCKSTLAKAGYQQYEISNFSIPGFESKQNSHYWNFDSYLGFGCGAHSFLRFKNKNKSSKEKTIGIRWANEKDMQSYLNRVGKDEDFKLPVEQIEIDLAKSEFFLTGLRRLSGITYRHFQSIFGSNLLEDYDQQIKSLTDQGLLNSSKEAIYLTDKGLLFADEVCRQFVINL